MASTSTTTSSRSPSPSPCSKITDSVAAAPPPPGAHAATPHGPTPADKQEKSSLAEWDENITQYLPLYKAALHGEWEIAKAIIDTDPDALSAKITRFQESVLHIAVSTSHSIHFVRNPVNTMSVEALEIKDSVGNTAFSFAAICGNLEAAKMLVRKNRRLPQIANNKNDTKLHCAASFDHKDLVEYLLPVTTHDPPHPFSGEPGVKLLNFLITADFYY